jgi:hypothetical protein
MPDTPSTATFGFHLARSHIGAPEQRSDILAATRCATSDTDGKAHVLAVGQIVEQAAGA